MLDEDAEASETSLLKYMSDRITQLRTDFEQELLVIATEADASSLRDRWVGRKSGLLTTEMKTLGKLSPDERKALARHHMDQIRRTLGMGVRT